jgi:RimJ/RimL family protein N-acetyltransferase
MMTMKVNDVVFLRGRKVILRPLEQADVPLLTRWINDPEVRQYLVSQVPQSEEMERNWVSKIDPNNSIVLGIQIIDGPLIGTLAILHISWRDRLAITGTMIGEKQYWGKGYGTDAKMVLLDYAFNTLNLHKVCSGACGFNKRSIRYSLRCGYKIEAVRKKHLFRNGRYCDQVELAIFRKNWEPVWKRYKKTGKVR